MLERVSGMETEISPLEAAKRNPLMLGLFLPIQSGAWSPSTAPRETSWTFDYNARCTVMAERLGFDLVFGLAQWMGKGGYGGEMKFREMATDPLLVTAGLAALDEAHPPRLDRAHPLRLAPAPPRQVRRHHLRDERRAMGPQHGHRLQEERVRNVRARADRARPSLRHGRRIRDHDGAAVVGGREPLDRRPLLEDEGRPSWRRNRPAADASWSTPPHRAPVSPMRSGTPT